MLYFRQFYTRVWSVRQQPIVFAFPAFAYHKPSGICVVSTTPWFFPTEMSMHNVLHVQPCRQGCSKHVHHRQLELQFKLLQILTYLFYNFIINSINAQFLLNSKLKQKLITKRAKVSSRCNQKKYSLSIFVEYSLATTILRPIL